MSVEGWEQRVIVEGWESTKDKQELKKMTDNGLKGRKLDGDGKWSVKPDEDKQRTMVDVYG